MENDRKREFVEKAILHSIFFNLHQPECTGQSPIVTAISSLLAHSVLATENQVIDLKTTLKLTWYLLKYHILDYEDNSEIVDVE